MDSSCKPVEKSTEGGMENRKAVEPSGKLEAAAGCCSCPARSRVLPPEYRNELRELFKLAGPVVSSCPVVRLSNSNILWQFLAKESRLRQCELQF